MLMQTDQKSCYDSQGKRIACRELYQDGATQKGLKWPHPRFAVIAGGVSDVLTGLTWMQNANPAEFPLTWKEAEDYIRELNKHGLRGYHDWRLPNRRELFSLISHRNINPSLPSGHPFTSVYNGYYWSSSTCRRLPDQAWYIHMGGGRVFKGMKANSYLVWPVRTGRQNPLLHLIQTGQTTCFNTQGEPIDCSGSMQDSAFSFGASWPKHRLVLDTSETVLDRMSGLIWHRNADPAGEDVDWETAQQIISEMNYGRTAGVSDWRLPNIIELESLVHLDRYRPAVVGADLFDNIAHGYWSGTTSMYDPIYTWVLYTEDGNIGVGHKPQRGFRLWAVR